MGLLALQLATALVVVAVTTVYMLWRHTARRLRQERALAIRVDRDPATAAKRAGTMHGGLLDYEEVDHNIVASSPRLHDMDLVSLGAYFASLVPQGSVSWERAIISVADRFGLTAALPLALFLPNAWRTEAGAGGLLGSFPSLAASAFVKTAISTLDVAAFAQTVHLYASGQRRERDKAAAAAAAAANGKGQQQAAAASNNGGALAKDGAAAERAAREQLAEPVGPLEIFRRGAPLSKGGKGEAIAEEAPLPSPLLLSAEGVLAAAGVSPEEVQDTTPAPAPPPKPLSPLLPDLHLGNGGLVMTHTRSGVAVCRLMACVANRLAANALAGLPQGVLPRDGAQGQAQQAQQAQQGQGGEPKFAVRLREGGPLLDSVEGLLGALREEGHSVQLALNSNLTSFGIGLSVHNGGGRWQQVPLAYPMRCSGLWARDEQGQQLDVVTMISHASVILTVKGPLLNFDLEWCLSVEGFTGWLPYAFVRREWATAEEFKISHPIGPDAGSPAQQRRLARLVTCASCILNAAAQRDRLLFGGYGHIGVCVDSVAAIQQAMLGSCTLFPLLLGGEAKSGLMSLYRDAQQPQQQHGEQQLDGGEQQQGGKAAARWEYSDEAAALQAALAALPFDAIQEPTTAVNACRRALACLPERSPFAAVAMCRRSLQAALREATALCPA